MRKAKKLFFQHFNCIPWFVVGIQILIAGNISRWQYFLCWISTMALLWIYCPGQICKEEKEEMQ